jgi:hypothetical protein
MFECILLLTLLSTVFASLLPPAPRKQPPASAAAQSLPHRPAAQRRHNQSGKRVGAR